MIFESISTNLTPLSLRGAAMIRDDEAIWWEDCGACRLPRFPFAMLRALAHRNDDTSYAERF